MKSSEIEAWALGAIESLLGDGSEDSRIEAKAQWPSSPARVARRIAGHANAARGEEILWLIGVDEKARRITPVRDAPDFANWWPQVQKTFEGPVPRPTEQQVYHPDGTVLALVFSTEEAPYVVKNPKFGEDKGSPEREVPWREMTSVRSATHADLISILVPLAKLPDVEVIDASLKAHARSTNEFGDAHSVETGGPCTWIFKADLYFTPRTSSTPLVFPAHKISVSVNEPGTFGTADFLPVEKKAPLPYKASDRSRGVTFGPTIGPLSDIVLEGPRRHSIRAEFEDKFEGKPRSKAHATIKLEPATIHRSILIKIALKRDDDFSYRLVNSTEG